MILDWFKVDKIRGFHSSGNWYCGFLGYDIYLFIYSLFNDVISGSSKIASDGAVISEW
jgi:hypothetical protein